jgi:hypothetical protein
MPGRRVVPAGPASFWHCLVRSTYARCGIIVKVTPFEPEWKGHVTIEISNTTPLPAKICANEGIAQVLFFQSDEPRAMSYKDKKGKYQAQRIDRVYNLVKIINLTSMMADCVMPPTMSLVPVPVVFIARQRAGG